MAKVEANPCAPPVNQTGRPEDAARGSGLYLALVLAAAALSACADSGATGGGNDAAIAVDLATCTGPGCYGLCLTDVDCKAGRRCDVSHHACVACLDDRDCPVMQVCDPVGHTCGSGCSAKVGCPDASVCEVDAGVCVECLGDADCVDAARPRCDVANRRCVACLPDKDNCAKSTYCLPGNNTYACVPGCKDDSDCAAMADGGMGSARCAVNDHRCVECLGDNDCPMGEICRQAACVVGCSAQRPCANNLSCCNGSCSEPTSDPLNCGACGVACPGGWDCCTSTCVNPANSLMNCGGCGVTCLVSHGTPACEARTCAVGACDAGWGDCNGVYKDGCETSLRTNVDNCGACGNACAFHHAFPACAGGVCIIDTCLYPFGDCDGIPQDGCESDLGSDPMNCGACGRVCSAINGVATCLQSTCSFICNPGFGDCNRDPADGCEAATSADVRNCGACGNVCPAVANGVAGCAMGVCGVRTCNAGFADCDGNAANGCEANLLSDASNCGNCGVPCGVGKACVNGACIAQALTLSFAAPVNYGVDMHPYAMAMGDINGDGKTDLVAVCQSANDVVLYLGNGDGTFAAGGAFAVGQAPYSVALADFNGDTKLDLAVANGSAANVTVQLGNGNGTFGAAVPFAVGTTPDVVLAGDLNADGRVDLAVADNGSGNVSILLGNGNGSFQPAVNYAADLRPYGMALGDLNGDGAPDLVVAPDSSNLTFLFGGANGVYKAGAPIVLDPNLLGVAISDLNADGKPDVVAADYGAGHLSVLVATGNGNFQAPAKLSAGGGPLNVAIGDLDLDGKPDIAVTNYTGNSVSVVLGNGDGTFAAASKSFAVGLAPRPILLSDFNRDGKLDIAIANEGAANISVLINTSK